MSFEIKYVADALVDEVLDAKLRGLLHECFRHNGYEGFEHKRYYHELPKHRWIVSEGDKLIAHIAGHEKTFLTKGKEHAFLGIAEVCVDQAYRGRGLVKTMFAKLERDLPQFDYSILLGDEGVYGSSGYVTVHNVFFPELSEQAADDVMVKCFKGAKWPTEAVTIKGPTF